MSQKEKTIMNKIQPLASKHVLIFATIVTFVFILLVILSSIFVNARWPADTSGWYIGSTIGRLVSIFILLAALSRLGWLGPAGFKSLGRLNTWLIMLLPLAYAIAVSAYAMTGNFDFSFSDPVLAAAAALFLLIHAFLEEVAFRGLILHGFEQAWGSNKPDSIKCVLISSIFFGGYHLIYILGEPLPVVLLRMVSAFLLGILLGALVLRGKSIYPAAVLHGVLNLAGYLNLTSNATQGTPSGWLLLSLAMIPLAGLGLYMLRGLPDQSAIPVAT
jgi:membrane protease YdiL (CAAX protease family)